ncbi:MAG: hypothetical protein COY49_03345 [Comamonadaceae bacterium CG_4_10_14_0_8_um_filter_57_29]|nr:MAG: hypothetical protein COY49_03345 [Comamonadaceae bacterium CG_4_10_14_0_8_um_filter_57_29]
MMSDHMKVSKGMEFPVVALPGVGHIPAKGEDEQEAARVFYVAATRASLRLVIGGGGDGGLGRNWDCLDASDFARLNCRKRCLQFDNADTSEKLLYAVTD